MLTLEIRQALHHLGEIMGEMADLPGGFLDDIKPSVGGIRFKLVKNQNTVLRLDIGVGKDDSSGFYFGVKEAF